MSSGEYLYLAMVIVSFTIFGAALAYTTEAEAHAARRAARDAGRPR